MSFRAPLFDHAAKPLVLSLVSVLTCTAAWAQSPFAGRDYTNRPAIPGYASRWQSFNHDATKQRQEAGRRQAALAADGWPAAEPGG
jgi:hypothetical protein